MIHSFFRILLFSFICPMSYGFLSRTFTRHLTNHHDNLVLFSQLPTRISLQKALQMTQQKHIRFIDATWYHKCTKNPRVSFEQGPRIAGSVYFDLDDICSNENASLSHMLPSGTLLESWMEHYQIQPTQDHLILYGQKGSWFLPRVWFTFYSLGHEQVFILEADLDEWIELGGLIDTQPITTVHRNALKIKDFTQSRLREKARHVIDLETMKKAVEQQNAILLDARGSSFAQDGHMPGALHLPYSSLGDTVRLDENLLERFYQIGIDPLDESKPIICSCGSGVSACTLYLALYECGRRQAMSVYDGSWEEWGSYPDLPKVPTEYSQ